MHKDIPRWKLFFSIGICLLVGFSSKAYMGQSLNTWYTTLVLPDLDLPDILFPIVWTILYILMGISLYFFWGTKKKRDATTALLLFFTQLFLNFLWPIAFFYLHSPILALFINAFLIVFVGLTIHYFFRTNRLSSYLLIPYLLWILFSFYLNYEIYLLNS